MSTAPHPVRSTVLHIPAAARHSRYDKFPSTSVEGKSWRGKDAWQTLMDHSETTGACARIVVDVYPGADLLALIQSAQNALTGVRLINVEEAAALSPQRIQELVSATLTDDRVFGVMSHHRLADFYDGEALATLGRQVESSDDPVLLIGWGASLVPIQSTTLVLADMPRWEVQSRMRNGASNWRAANGDEDILRKFKRGYFLDWRVADRHKRSLFHRIDFVLDSTRDPVEPKVIAAATFHSGMESLVSSPFRVVPFFDPGVWGGQWMKEAFGLDAAAANYAWCFDCVPEENSILLEVDGETIELPAMNVVLTKPRELLGERTFARYGAEFPIRFDFLDTMGGGNLSLQVHPLTDYITTQFGMPYTQDESYYLLDAEADATVYLGLKSGTSPAQLERHLRAAADGSSTFAADDYINRFPAKKHDHFSIPAGTVHCSGAGAMVLEISATPYIFTFKMWDWARLGLDGIPRPVHLDHALANVQWDRDTEWVRRELLDQVTPIDSGTHWREEHTGLHEFESIEVRRHWFTGAVEHDTAGTVNVLNLVEGAEAVVDSPTAAFAPFVVHYAETFIVPAAVGRYTVRPLGFEANGTHATVKAFIRGTQREA